MRAKREEKTLPAAGEGGPRKERGPLWGRLLFCEEGLAESILGKYLHFAYI